MDHQTGCLICGKPLIYGEPREVKCTTCEKVETTQVMCISGHYVCDSCHTSSALEYLEHFFETTTETDPTKIMKQVFKHPSFHMHGPEHHTLAPVILLAALRNQGTDIPANAWQLILARTASLPGGTCGYWGACAASIGTGIAASILTESHPLNARHYGNIHSVTASGLSRIAEIGGPRCCKRNLFLSIEEAAKTLREKFTLSLDMSHIVCGYFPQNEECLEIQCPYYPKKD